MLNYLIDILFPAPRPLEQVATSDLARVLQKKAIPKQTPANWLHTCFYYRDTDVRSLILHLKKYRDQRVYDALAGRLHDLLLDLESEYFSMHGLRHTILVPIPMHASAQKIRGFNQSEVLARTLAKRSQERSVKPLLYCPKPHHKQALLPRNKRIENMQNAFQSSRHAIPDRSLIIIIDDVTTTGATLQEARLQLLSHAKPEHILALTIAH